MKVKTLFHDDDYALVQGLRFGMSHGLLCPIYVLVQNTGDAFKAKLSEKLFLLTVVGEMVKLGAVFPGDASDEMFLRFAEAITSRGSIRWQLFFRDGDARQRAAELIR